MASNHKLTAVIKGRTIQGTQNQGDTLTIRFDDGSTMTVKTAGSTNSAATGGKVDGVRQQDTTLDIDFDGGATMSVPLAEANSCVMVRDRNHTMEYAD